MKDDSALKTTGNGWKPLKQQGRVFLGGGCMPSTVKTHREDFTEHVADFGWRMGFL